MAKLYFSWVDHGTDRQEVEWCRVETSAGQTCMALVRWKTPPENESQEPDQKSVRERERYRTYGGRLCALKAASAGSTPHAITAGCGDRELQQLAPNHNKLIGRNPIIVRLSRAAIQENASRRPHQVYNDGGKWHDVALSHKKHGSARTTSSLPEIRSTLNNPNLRRCIMEKKFKE
ncbi:uncharacterized protein LOC118645577 [Monomorium pharaonis]|uniref:uncharacterized protein LOC118645577 n=1 Tax=Monomorium pharaonis TaxID=307658 RepID=UPI001746D97E|nr:uncharacterized protein LOC118645577 [Monomorium pharaonis]